jgi:hypothetical protein
MSTSINIAKINLKESKTAFLITGILVVVQFINMLLAGLIAPGESQSLAIGDYFYLFPVLIAILIPATHFSKIMHLGGKRKDFFKSCIIAYIPATAAAAFITTVLQFTIYLPLANRGINMFSVAEVFGFASRGPIICFLQTFAFFIMFCSVLHTLTLVQGHFYGWAVDVIIIAIISVFTPIPPLRAALVWFFNLIIFDNNVVLQILACLIIAAAVYSLSIIPIRAKQSR